MVYILMNHSNLDHIRSGQLKKLGKKLQCPLRHQYTFDRTNYVSFARLLRNDLKRRTWYYREPQHDADTYDMISAAHGIDQLRTSAVTATLRRQVMEIIMIASGYTKPLPGRRAAAEIKAMIPICINKYNAYLAFADTGVNKRAPIPTPPAITKAPLIRRLNPANVIRHLVTGTDSSSELANLYRMYLLDYAKAIDEVCDILEGYPDFLSMLPPTITQLSTENSPAASDTQPVAVVDHITDDPIVNVRIGLAHRMILLNDLLHQIRAVVHCREAMLAVNALELFNASQISPPKVTERFYQLHNLVEQRWMEHLAEYQRAGMHL
jgi:hypothetical protein